MAVLIDEKWSRTGWLLLSHLDGIQQFRGWLADAKPWQNQLFRGLIGDGDAVGRPDERLQQEVEVDQAQRVRYHHHRQPE